MQPLRVSTHKAFSSIRWPVMFALLTAIVFFVGASTVRETYRGWKVDQEIEGLKNQVSKLESQKHSMTRLLETMKTEGYIEQEARLRFNLKKPHEQVILFDEATAQPAMKWSEQGGGSDVQTPVSSPSFPRRWFEYFMGGKAIHL